ncbi:hypothetical protein EXIGLDRAFT_782391 [Exidia glandulosa HHB12029]|uniref:Uncharacterized protein n=1 Tax=Exidia glandulosa HHB12029 TaxID=1314781 RepID=A0A165AU63_EXIGL|nr:hypothetical protein EXIGLDRAFT_782391 [Exidia glandulosa HHB12029]
MFELEPGVDDPNLAGANSSVCSIPEVSMYSGTDGQLFSFSFHGVAVQLVLSSRPDHSPFGVSIDGGPEELKDSYSVGARCGVAWSREGLSLGNHTVRTTAHIAYPRIFLELLSIMCIRRRERYRRAIICAAVGFEHRCEDGHPETDAQRIGSSAYIHHDDDADLTVIPCLFIIRVRVFVLRVVIKLPSGHEFRPSADCIYAEHGRS